MQQSRSQQAPAYSREADAPRRNYIDGQYRPSAGGKSFETRNPATGEVLARIEIAEAAEIEQAVEAAKRGQARWAARTGAERGRVLQRVAELLRARNEELAELETLDTGKPIQETSAVDIISGAECFEYFAGLAGSIAGEHVDLGPGAFGYTRREPLGVVAGIGAWNYPIQIACWKSAPAPGLRQCHDLQAGRTHAADRAQAGRDHDRGRRAGRRVQCRAGLRETGRLLTRHPQIRKVSLTGEVGTGKKVMADAAETLKYVTLELGGKSPLIVFEDADLDDAVSGALLANFYSAGEVCSNGTRVFVHERVRAAFLDKLATRGRKDEDRAIRAIRQHRSARSSPKGT